MDLFETIRFKPDKFLLNIIYSACASLCNERAIRLGTKVFDEMPKNYSNDIMIISSAIHMFMNFGHVKKAESIYSQISRPDIVVYGAMMSGYVNNQNPLKCLKFFEEIYKDNLIPDEPVILSLIGACSQIGHQSTCERILNDIPLKHRHSRRVANCLIDMWVCSRL